MQGERAERDEGARARRREAAGLELGATCGARGAKHHARGGDGQMNMSFETPGKEFFPLGTPVDRTGGPGSERPGAGDPPLCHFQKKSRPKKIRKKFDYNHDLAHQEDYCFSEVLA